MNTEIFSAWNNWCLHEIRVKYNSFSVFDHFLASFPDRVSQSGVRYVGISDHQLLYCTREIARIKSYYHKQITFLYHKNYILEVSKKTLIKLNFPNYELFDNTDKAYKNLNQNVMAVINNIASSKNEPIKCTS